jgi:uncharacterized protein YbjQ (UPF0145 family)
MADGYEPDRNISRAQPRDPQLPQVARVGEARLSDVGKLFTSDLSVSDFSLLHSVQAQPLEFVMGTSVYHIGYQGGQFSANQELGVLTAAMYNARDYAIRRMEEEAAFAGADGVVGVKLGYRTHGEPHHIEFLAYGTAIRWGRQPGALRLPDGRPFTSDLSVPDFVTLLGTNHVPVAFVMGNCVYHVAVNTMRQLFRQAFRNTEIPQWTQGHYTAREVAMTRLHDEAEAYGATGVVGMDVSVSEWVWGFHTLEFFATGTGIKPFETGVPSFLPSITLPTR